MKLAVKPEYPAGWCPRLKAIITACPHPRLPKNKLILLVKITAITGSLSILQVLINTDITFLKKKTCIDYE
jgi:hypothetical protein